MAEQDFIVRIRGAEQQAEDLLMSAREQSRIDLEKAREEAADMIETARYDAETAYNKALDDAREQVVLIESGTSYDVKIKTDNLAIDKAAEVVAERIVKDCVNR